jgi:DNA repair ATPase RecN
MSEQPTGVIFERNNVDFMNNFYIDITCRAFTNIEDIHRQAQENKELNKQNSALRELKELSSNWKADIDKLVESQFNQYDTQIMTKHKQLEAQQENEDWEKLNKELTTRKS